MLTAERYSDFEEVLRTALRGFQAGVWTAMPGVIQSFDATKLTATVQVAIQGTQMLPPTIQGVKQDYAEGTTKQVDIPLLLDVPVVFPRGGQTTITMPIGAGDEVLVVFASRCIDAWWQSGGTKNVAMEARMHDLSDGFAIPGPFSQVTKIANFSSKNLQIRSNDGQTIFELDPSGKVVHIKALSGFKVDGDITVTGKSALKGDVTVTGKVDATGAVTAASATLTGALSAASMAISGTATMGTMSFGSMTGPTGSGFSVSSAGAVAAASLAVAGVSTFSDQATFAHAGAGAALQVRTPNQAQIDLWDDTPTGATPAGGSRWRIFADNVGGGGGDCTLGFYDIPNARVAAGFDNSGNLVANVGIKCPKWAVYQPINSAGPMPLSATFTSHGGTLVLIADGSGYATGAASIWMSVDIDGVSRCTPQVFTNEAASHKAFAQRFAIVTDVAEGSHTMTIRPGAATLSNTDDWFSVLVLELPF